MSGDFDNYSRSSIANDGSSEEISNASNLPILLNEQEILLVPENTSTDLLNSLNNFRVRSLNESVENLSRRSGSLHTKIGEYDNYIFRHTEKRFSIGIIEHYHYIYSYRENFPNLSQEAIGILENRERQFNGSENLEYNIYNGLKRLLTFLSKLLFRWGIFDINNYGYRYKGRSLTVRVVDMMKINEQCLTADIFWFSYAIKHKPFIDKIEKAVLCYGEILQFEMDKVIDYLRSNSLEGLNFDIAPKWKLFTKNDPAVMALHELLIGLELAYRYFEKNLIQEFLKVV